MITLILLLLMLAGCATEPIHPQSDIYAAQHITLPPTPEDEVVEAIQELFRLADPDDVEFMRAPGRMEVHRQIYVLLAMMSENWGIFIEEKQEATNLFVAAYTHTTEGLKYPPRNTYPYELFRIRLEYLLGLRDTWESCKEFRTRTGIGTKILCAYTDDHRPE